MPSDCCYFVDKAAAAGAAPALYYFGSILHCPAVFTQNLGQTQAECRSTYGYPRVHIWLERNGLHCNPKTVLRVMNKYNLLSVIRRKRYVKYGEFLHRYPNLLNRNTKTKLTPLELRRQYVA